MSVTQRFANAFDSSNRAHVIWLSKFFDFAENLAKERPDIDSMLNSNPMGIVVKKDEMLDWVQIHFMVSMKYARDVLTGKAFIPSKYSRVSP